MNPLKVFSLIGLTVIGVIIIIWWQENQVTPEVENLDTFTYIDTTSEQIIKDTAILNVTHLDTINYTEVIPLDSVYGKLLIPNNNSFNFISEKLRNNKEHIRITYFGDSQLEGDFLCSTIRMALQDKYGGKGPGLIAADQYYSNEHKLSISLSGNWKQSERMKITKDNSSILFRHASIYSDKGKININRLKLTGTSKDYNVIKLFFISKSSAKINISSKDSVYCNKLIDGSSKAKELCINLTTTPTKLEIEIDATGEFIINGISLESKTGIHIDNIPIRGQAFPPLTSSDTTLIKSFFSMLPSDLFFLQFGANYVSCSSEKLIHKYISNTETQIKLIKKWHPNAAIIIIGISDIAKKTTGKYISYPSVSKIKLAQYQLATNNNCGFWDLDYFIKENGGIITWANSKPALARQDYLHFTKYGARKIGAEISKLLISELEK